MKNLFILHKEEKGITGLETAIILIAFAMVASVFAYVVLSAGMFSSQKAKDAINAGLEEVGSTVELKGDVIARSDNGTITNIYVTLGAHPKSNAVDFTDTSSGNNKVIISYADSYQQFPALDWTLNKLNSSNATDNLLDSYELFQLDIDVSSVSANATTPEARLGPYHTFTLEIKPPVGPIIAIERQIPARMSPIMNLK